MFVFLFVQVLQEWWCVVGDFGVLTPQNRPRPIFNPGGHWHLCRCFLLPGVCYGKRSCPKSHWMPLVGLGFFIFVLFSIMMVTGQSRHGAVSLVSGRWIAGIPMSLWIAAAFMAQLLLMCTLGSLCKLSCIFDVIRTGSGFVADLNMYLAVSPLMRWIIGRLPASLLIRAEGAEGGVLRHILVRFFVLFICV